MEPRLVMAACQILPLEPVMARTALVPMVMDPDKVDAEFQNKEAPSRKRLALVRLAPALSCRVISPPLPPTMRAEDWAKLAMETVYVPELVIKAVSAAPGSWFGLQLAVFAQLPPAMLVQTRVAAGS